MIDGGWFPRGLVRLLQAGIAIAILALLWQTADGPEAIGILSRADPVWLGAAFLALTLQTLLSAMRWRLTAAQLGIFLHHGDALREYYLAQVVNQTLPGGVLGDAGRALRSRGEAGLLASGLAVMIERLAGQIALFITMAFAFVITFALPNGVAWPDWLAMPVAALIAAGISLLLAAGAMVRLPGAFGRSARGFRRAFVLALLSRKVRVRQALLSTGTVAANLAAFWFCARAIGVPLSLAATLALVPIILFTMVIPLSISGWGFREGAAAVLFPVIGATASEGLAASIAFGLMILVAALPGAAFIFTRPRAQISNLRET